MSSVVQSAAASLVSLFTHGFAVAIERSEIWLFERIDTLIVEGAGSQVGSPWFYHFFQKMEILALGLVLPLFLVGVILAQISGSGSMLTRLTMLYLPVSLIGSGLFFFAVEGLTASFDAMSSWLVSSSGVNLSSLSGALPVSGVPAGSPSEVPFLLIAVGGTLSVLAALSLYFELLLRQGVILLLTALVPFGILFMLIGSSRVTFYRYLEVTAMVIAAKFVVVVLLCLGALLIINASGLDGFSQFLSGSAVLLLASFSPFLLFSLIPVAHLDHQSQMSHSLRRTAVVVSQRGLGGGTGGTDMGAPGDIPLANATLVPSYLRDRGK